MWYFAHPYTVKDKKGNFVPEAETANFDLCNQRAARLVEEGYIIFSPISMSHSIHRASPTLLSDHAHAFWYFYNSRLLESASWEGIILAPGWNLSPGCRMEATWFRQRKLPVREYAKVITDEGKQRHVVKMTHQIQIVTPEAQG